MSAPKTDRVNPEEASAGQLVSQLTEDVSTLVRDEVALAKRDLATAGKRVGAGAGLFGAAGVIVWFAVATFVAAAVLGLATAVDAWLAALIVAVALLVLAAVAALLGKSSVEKAPEPPRERVDSVKADISAASASQSRPSWPSCSGAGGAEPTRSRRPGSACANRVRLGTSEPRRPKWLWSLGDSNP